MVSNMVDLFEILTKPLLAIVAVSFVLYVVANFLDLRASRKGRDKNDDTEDD